MRDESMTRGRSNERQLLPRLCFARFQSFLNSKRRFPTCCESAIVDSASFRVRLCSWNDPEVRALLQIIEFSEFSVGGEGLRRFSVVQFFSTGSLISQ